MDIDTSAWSGDGDFTAQLLEALKGVDEIAAIRLEDAPASRTGTGYNFLVNEFFLTFAAERVSEPGRWLRLVPVTRRVLRPRLTLAALDARLALVEGIGSADYSDEGMLQYLRTQVVVAPYQSRGYKLVEMVRVYGVRPDHSGPSSNGPG